MIDDNMDFPGAVSPRKDSRCCSDAGTGHLTTSPTPQPGSAPDNELLMPQCKVQVTPDPYGEESIPMASRVYLVSEHPGSQPVLPVCPPGINFKNTLQTWTGQPPLAGETHPPSVPGISGNDNLINNNPPSNRVSTLNDSGQRASSKLSKHIVGAVALVVIVSVVTVATIVGLGADADEADVTNATMLPTGAPIVGVGADADEANATNATMLPTGLETELPPGLQHLYRGEGNAEDSINGLNGTLGSATTFQPGINGLAFSFDGTRESMVQPLGVDISPEQLPQLTMGLWVYLRSIPSTLGWVLTHDDGGFDRALILHDDRFGGVAAGVGNSYGSTLPYISLNEWHCIAVAYHHDESKATIYYDGLTQTVEASPGQGLSTTSLGGSWGWFSSPHEIDGLVDEVFFYAAYLSGEEIETVCNSVLTS